jgi:hypothetical protein
MKERLSEMSSRSTAGAANTLPIADMKVKLSILWVFAVLNYIYADVFTARCHRQRKNFEIAA